MAFIVLHTFCVFTLNLTNSYIQNTASTAKPTLKIYAICLFSILYLILVKSCQTFFNIEKDWPFFDNFSCELLY